MERSKESGDTVLSQRCTLKGQEEIDTFLCGNLVFSDIVIYCPERRTTNFSVSKRRTTLLFLQFKFLKSSHFHTEI